MMKEVLRDEKTADENSCQEGHIATTLKHSNRQMLQLKKTKNIEIL